MERTRESHTVSSETQEEGALGVFDATGGSPSVRSCYSEIEHVWR